MKIITVNLPVSYLKTIEELVGNQTQLYPSRSELIRVAIREFLMHELETAQAFLNPSKPVEQKKEPEIDQSLFVRVPVAKKPGETPEMEYKTFRIIKKNGETPVSTKPKPMGVDWQHTDVEALLHKLESENREE